MTYWDGTRWVAEETTTAARAPRIARRLLGATAEAGLISALIFGLIASSAFAAKGGGGSKPSGGAGGGTLTLVMVTDANSNGSPNWGDTVTFNVSTSATSSPEVKLTCYQGGVAVYWTQTAYYAGYPFPWTQMMQLQSGAWTGGAADCTAVLYYSSGRKTVTLTSKNFHVDA
jgi:hypothetical protein